MKTLIFIFLSISSASFALEQQHSSSFKTTSTDVMSHPTGFIPFLGIESGYTLYDKKIDVEGMPSAIKLLGSYYTFNKEYVFDLGIGIMNQKFSQASAEYRSITDTALEIAARYRWENAGWQAGLIETTFFNQGSSYFANQADAQFLGLQALKEIKLTPDVFARLGGRIMTDLNVNHRNVNMAMIDLQLGWKEPLNSTKIESENISAQDNQKSITKTTTEEVTTTTTATSTSHLKSNSNRFNESPVANTQTTISKSTTEETYEQTPKSISTLKIILPTPTEKLGKRALRELLNKNNLATFDVNSSSIPKAAQNNIQKISAILAKNSDLFSKVEIIGHADKSGTTEKNIELSKKRAQSVAQIFMNNGFNQNNIIITAEGAQSQPNNAEDKLNIDNNRRVELKFQGVKDLAKLQQLIKAL